MPKPQVDENFSQEELDRMEAHVRSALTRAGVVEKAINPDAVTYMAHFLHETHLAPTDYNMALIHRTIAWSVEAMKG